MWHAQVGGEHEGSRVWRALACIGMDGFGFLFGSDGFLVLLVLLLAKKPKIRPRPAPAPAGRACLPASDLTHITHHLSALPPSSFLGFCFLCDFSHQVHG